MVGTVSQNKLVDCLEETEIKISTKYNTPSTCGSLEIHTHQTTVRAMGKLEALFGRSSGRGIDCLWYMASLGQAARSCERCTQVMHAGHQSSIPRENESWYMRIPSMPRSNVEPLSTK